MDHEGARRAHIQEEGSGVPKVNACSGLSKVFRGELPEKCEIFVKRSLLGSPLTARCSRTKRNVLGVSIEAQILRSPLWCVARVATVRF